MKSLTLVKLPKVVWVKRSTPFGPVYNLWIDNVLHPFVWAGVDSNDAFSLHIEALDKHIALYAISLLKAIKL